MSRTRDRLGVFLQRAFQVRLASLIVLVAGSALVIEAWKYSRGYADPERAWVSIHIRALGDPQAGTRVAAVYELGKVRGPNMRQVVPALLGALRDEDTPVRIAAAHALGWTIGGSAGLLGDDVAGEIREVTPALIAAVGDKDPRVRAAAAGSLGSLGHASVGPDRLVALPALIRATHDPDPSVRATSVAGVGMLSDDKVDAPAVLIEALQDVDPRVRESAVISLGRPWRNRAEVFLILIERLSPTRKANEGQWTGFVLAKLGPPPVEAVPGLVKALRTDGDWSDRALVDFLAAIGPPARKALPKLAARAGRELQVGSAQAGNEHAGAFNAVPAMIAIAPDAPQTLALVPSLVERLAESNSKHQRRQAAECLIRLGPHARAAIPALETLLDSRDPEVRSEAELALKTIRGE